MKIKAFAAVALTLILAFSLCACSEKNKSGVDVDIDMSEDEAEIEYEGEYSKELAGTTINVFNWGEYIPDGTEGSLDINKAFTELTGIKINYTTYESNESMYSKLKGGGVSYDIIIPSDYMIERMKKEDMLQKIDTSSLSNYKYIAERYKDLYFDEKNEYSVPYCVGMVGLIYNSAMISEKPDSWGAMWDKRYNDNILNFNNPRDAFAVAQLYMGYDLNSSDYSQWDSAAEKLKEQKSILQSYVMDEIFQKMEDGEAAIAPYYAGDFLLMKDNNSDLEFVYPKEGVNIFVDSICIPKSSKNYKAAMMYINFLLEPEIALEVAEYVMYASPHTGVIENDDYSLKDNEYLYPSEENSPRVQYFHDIPEKTRMYYERLWEDVKLY
ncbi:MAG: spermidine/putrescine ABC transporter substrate-binding protein [Clostridia bacterium]|nr:spermidine/putrescine ABC transporter substrate-binding protein [Clostridia bacterium]